MYRFMGFMDRMVNNLVHNIFSYLFQDDGPSPGEPYMIDFRTAYLPDTRQGQHIAELLQVAFDQGEIFAIGVSHNSGIHREGIIWNGIDHRMCNQ